MGDLQVCSRFRCVMFYQLTSRERPKSAPYLRLKIVRGGPFDFEKFPKKIFKNVIFEQFHSAEKCKRGDPLGFFDIHCVAKYRNK